MRFASWQQKGRLALLSIIPVVDVLLGLILCVPVTLLINATLSASQCPVVSEGNSFLCYSRRELCGRLGDEVDQAAW